MKPTPADAGRHIAQILATCWRPEPEPPKIDPEVLPQIARQLQRSVSAPLAWWRLRDSILKDTPAAQDMRQAFLYYTLRAAEHERNLVAVIRRLREHEIEPVLAKGWSVARLYPRPGLRPYGDYDLCVAPERYDAALEAVAGFGEERIEVDLHRRFRELDLEFSAMASQSQVVCIQGVDVRVLAPEEHFRLLCIHLLYHGVTKPLWLCDVSLMLETLGATIDWDRCLAGSARRKEWVLTAVALAHQLLGSNVPEPLAIAAERRIPGWVLDSVLKQWGSGETYMHGNTAQGLLHSQSNPFEVLQSRWPSPLQATIRTGAPINRLPRLPLQIIDVARRATKVAKQRRRTSKKKPL